MDDEYDLADFETPGFRGECQHMDASEWDDEPPVFEENSW